MRYERNEAGLAFPVDEESSRFMCVWFLKCDRPAEWATRGPVGNGEFDMVPVCQRCADKVGIPAEELYDYELQLEEA